MHTDATHLQTSAVARPNGQPRQAGVARGVRGFLGLSVTFFPVNLSGI